MIERIYILENVDPVIFYGVNNANMQLIKTLFPKLRIVARGNVMKVIGEEEESELFLKKIREIEKYCEEFNTLGEDTILDIVKGNAPVVARQENLIIHGMNGKPITARTENQQNWSRRSTKTTWSSPPAPPDRVRPSSPLPWPYGHSRTRRRARSS